MRLVIVRMWATRTRATDPAIAALQSLASRRERPSHAKVRSTTHRLALSGNQHTARRFWLKQAKFAQSLLRPIFPGEFRVLAYASEALDEFGRALCGGLTQTARRDGEISANGCFYVSVFVRDLILALDLLYPIWRPQRSRRICRVGAASPTITA